MRGGKLERAGAIALGVLGVIGLVGWASQYGYASMERRLLVAELEETRARAERVSAGMDDLGTELVQAKQALGVQRNRTDALGAEIAVAREALKLDGVAFAQLTAMWEKERDEGAIYSRTLRNSARELGGRGSVVAHEWRAQVESEIRRVNAGLERAAMDVLVSEEIIAARPSHRELGLYRRRLSLLDSRGWAAERMADNLVTFVRGNLAMYAVRDPAGEIATGTQVEEWCATMKEGAGLYRRAAQACVDACRESSCSVGTRGGWVATELRVRDGEHIVLTVAGLFAMPRDAAPSMFDSYGAVRLRVQGSEAELPGAVHVRPTTPGQIEVATTNESIGRETDSATVTLWTFRPLAGGR